MLPQEGMNRMQPRMKVQSPLHDGRAFGHFRCGSNGFTSPKSRVNGPLRNELEVIRRQIMQVASAYPLQADTIASDLKQLGSVIGMTNASGVSGLYQSINSNKPQVIKTSSFSTQTEEPYLPPFCQQISLICDIPKGVAQSKCQCTPQYLKARESIYNDMYADNESLVRDNLKLAEENAQLIDAKLELSSKYEEITKKYEELERTIEMLHEVGSVYSSKVLNDGGLEKQDFLGDTGKFIYSPRSSNLSNRKSCLSKNTAEGYDQVSRRVGFSDIRSPRITIYKESGAQTNIQSLIYTPSNKTSPALHTLAASLAEKQQTLLKVHESLIKYLGSSIDSLTLDNASELLERLYRKRSANLIRRTTMSIEQIEGPEVTQMCKSDNKMDVITQKSQSRRICRRR